MKDSEILRWDRPPGYKPSRSASGGIAGDNAARKRRPTPPPKRKPKVVACVPGTRLLPSDRKVYEDRGGVLSKMGFESYDEYLASPTWRRIRKKALKRCRWKCCACGFRAIQVHHRNYSKATLTKGAARGLIAICVECHKKIEFRGGLKVGLAEANRRLRRLVKAHKRKSALHNAG